MTRTRFIAISVAALLALGLSAGAALSQDVPPGPTTRHRVEFQVVDPPAAPAELVQLVLDFAPGAFTPPHTHGGPTFVTVVEGEMTRRVGGTEETFRAGQGWVEPGEVHAAGNVASTTARVLVTALVPKGAVFTSVGEIGVTGEAPPGPTTVAQFRAEVDSPTGPFDLVHLILDFASGSFTPPHTHGGPTFVTVLDGEMTRRVGSAEDTFRPGETWVEPGVAHAAGNRAGTSASVGVAFLLPKDAPLTTVVAPAAAPAQVPSALPRTGSAEGLGLMLAAPGAPTLAAGTLLHRR